MLLIKRLMHLSYLEGFSMVDHLNQFQGVVKKLAGMGDPEGDAVQCCFGWCCHLGLGESQTP